MGVNYILFFFGSVIIAVIIFAIRSRDKAATEEVGLVVTPNPAVDEYNVLNLTQAIEDGTLPRNLSENLWVVHQ